MNEPTINEELRDLWQRVLELEQEALAFGAMFQRLRAVESQLQTTNRRTLELAEKLRELGDQGEEWKRGKENDE